MQKIEKQMKINVPTTEKIKDEIFNSKFTKIAIGTICILATVIAVGGILKIVNFTITNYKNLKVTLNN